MLLVGFAALRIADPAPIEEIRVRTFDTFQRFDPRAKLAKSPVTIVDIDEASLAKIGQWPWSRTLIADMVSSLTKLGAVAIGFDVIFAEPDRLNPDVAADTFRNLDEETKAKLRALPEQRSAFRGCDAALARGAGRVRTFPSQSRSRQVASGDGAGDAGRGSAAVHAPVSWPASQHAGSGKGGRRARLCSPSGPNATALCGGCR